MPVLDSPCTGYIFGGQMQLTWVTTSWLLSPGIWVLLSSASSRGTACCCLPSVSHIFVTLAGKELQSWGGWQTLAFSLSCQLSSSFCHLFFFAIGLLPKFQVFDVYFSSFSSSGYSPSAQTSFAFISPLTPTTSPLFFHLLSHVCLRLWRSSWVRCVAGSSLTALGSCPNQQL